MQCGATEFFQAYKTNREALGFDVPTRWYGAQLSVVTKHGEK
jgi:hypothetical protein